MKAIFLVRDLPDSRTNGYKKRNFYLLKELEKAKIDVILFREDEICASVNGKSKLLNAFLSLFTNIPFSVITRRLPLVKKSISVYIAKNPVDMIICDSVYRALNIPLDFKGKKILFEHNIESMIVKRYADAEKNIFKRIFAHIEYLKLSAFQRKIWKKFDTCIVCSELDKKILRDEINHKNIFVINNGVDINYFTPNSQLPTPNSIIYTGQIGWYPNEDAVMYFARDIFPLIKKKNPGVRFWVVGEKPSNRIKSLAKDDNSITVTGFVDDVRSLMEKASVFVVPLRIGGGTRLKILEALSMQKAVVSTSIGCEGLDVEDNKHILIKDKPIEFANAVSELLKNETLRTSLGNNGRRLVEEKYDWQTVFKDLDVILKDGIASSGLLAMTGRERPPMTK